MRIIAGLHKGRNLNWPKTPLVRPMTGMVRESLFNLLGSVEGLTVLDAYAGSGSVGFEALSRGASSVDAVEILRQAQNSIKQNIVSLNVADSYRLYPIAIEKWLSRSQPKRYDLIVAGPPFAALETEVISRLGQLLSAKGIMVLWHTSRIDPPKLQSLQLTDSRKYGDSQLSFYNWP